MIEKERNNFLKELKVFSEKRKEEKKKKHQRQPGKSQIQKLYSYGEWCIAKPDIMKISVKEWQKLIDLANSFKGKQVTVSESISRSRNKDKHNRHFSTYTKFSFTVENILVTFSGSQLLFTNTDAQYGISLDGVATFQSNENELEIIEHFEQETERQTKISAT